MKKITITDKGVPPRYHAELSPGQWEAGRSIAEALRKLIQSFPELLNAEIVYPGKKEGGYEYENNNREETKRSSLL